MIPYRLSYLKLYLSRLAQVVDMIMLLVVIVCNAARLQGYKTWCCPIKCIFEYNII